MRCSDNSLILLYTCPYHPRLNAIEQFFSQMKHYLKLYKSKNFEELKLNLKNSIKNIKKEHYENYFMALTQGKKSTQSLKYFKLIPYPIGVFWSILTSRGVILV